MELLKHTIRKFCNKLCHLSDEYEDRQKRKKFKIPRSVSIYKVSMEGNVRIGEYTYINEGSRIDSGLGSQVIIGKHCAVGRYVHITSKTHDLSCPTTDEKHSSINHVEADVLIGDYVWIGDKVTVLPGVNIGDYAVIGAHSLVTKDVNRFEVVAGSPAVHIKFNSVHYRFPVEKQ